MYYNVRQTSMIDLCTNIVLKTICTVTIITNYNNDRSLITEYIEVTADSIGVCICFTSRFDCI
jgi:hypothetical protein